MYESKYKEKKEQNHKVKFLTTDKIEVVRMEANLHYFPMASENRSKDKIIIAIDQRYLDQVN